MGLRRRLALLPLLGLAIAAPSAAAADCPGADVLPGAQPVEAARAAVVCLTNAERASAGLGALTAQADLEQAGQAYAERMVAQRFFDHVAPDGQVLGTRLAGYDGWSTVGENLAWGTGGLATPRATVAGWMASPGHRANILNGVYREVGIGIAQGSPRGDANAGTYAAEYGARPAGAAPAAVPAPAAPVTAPARPVAAAPARRPVAAPAARRAPARSATRRAVATRRVVRPCATRRTKTGASARGRRITRCAAIRVARR